MEDYKEKPGAAQGAVRGFCVTSLHHTACLGGGREAREFLESSRQDWNLEGEEPATGDVWGESVMWLPTGFQAGRRQEAGNTGMATLRTGRTSL